MIDAISAEALKFRRHRATWGLVWIWPIGVVLLWLLAIAIDLAKGGPSGDGPASAAGWIANSVDFWSLPAQPIGRYLLGAFVAVVFAGEYGWNTWKLIVPHRARSTLIAAKYVVALALLACGFTLAAIMFNLFGWIEDLATGDRIPAGIAAGALLQAHALAALAAVGPVLLTTAYVSLAAILTRSTVAALVIGLVVTTLEQLFRVYAPVLAFQAPGLVGALYQALPGYHLANLGSWIGEGQALVVAFPSGPFSMAPTASLAILAAWILGLTALTFRVFRRQDIN
ncbi:MAG TPA: ABC transporter permease [Allosphingosinicella sp.]|nr:ABC transporter permease [Allosphingosinicella sp.]